MRLALISVAQLPKSQLSPTCKNEMDDAKETRLVRPEHGKLTHPRIRLENKDSKGCARIISWRRRLSQNLQRREEKSKTKGQLNEVLEECSLLCWVGIQALTVILWAFDKKSTQGAAVSTTLGVMRVPPQKKFWSAVERGKRNGLV